jgi:hypothetical protein
VLLAELPVLHADIVKRIVGEQHDMSVVGEVDAGGPVRQAVERTQPDLMLVAATGSGLPCACLELVLAHPWLRVLALDVTGRQGSFVETRRCGWSREAWAEGLVDAIRCSAIPCGGSGPTGDRGGPR